MPTDIVRVVAYRHSHNQHKHTANVELIVSVNHAICDVLMIRFYSLFVTDDNLLASPYVRRFNVFHDLTLHRGASETVNFLLQTPLTPEQYDQLNVIYDPHTITISKVEVKSFKHQSLITVTLVPKELGSVKIGFAFPQTEHLHRARMQDLHSPLTATPFSEINRPKVMNRVRETAVVK